jgi:hypothetical protein
METCPYCGEPIAPTDRLAPGYLNARVHWECGLRAVIGGLNHLTARCTCCGGTDPPDPAGMTAREAARAAAEWWMNYKQ